MGVVVKTHDDGAIVVTDDRKESTDDGLDIPKAWGGSGGIAFAIHFGPDPTLPYAEVAARIAKHAPTKITHVGEIVEHVKLRPAGTRDNPLVFEWKGPKPLSFKDVVSTVEANTAHPFAVKFSKVS